MTNFSVHGLSVPVVLDPDSKATLARIAALLVQANNQLKQLIQKGSQMVGILDDIESEVQNQTTVEASIEKMVANLLATAGSDPTRLQAILQALQNNTSRMAALVVANTPADDTGGVIPPPVDDTGGGGGDVPTPQRPVGGRGGRA